MIKIYTDNGLPFFNAEWIRDRRYAEQVLADAMQDALRSANKVWQFEQIEAPCLMPAEASGLSSEYATKDIFMDTDARVILKPETTASSYAYLAHQFEYADHLGIAPPYCLWQTSKSFRRENDQVAKNVRLKEFYQQEFQCIVTDGTKMDYQNPEDMPMAIIEATVERLTGLPTRIVPSDRLPSYSDKTLDIEVQTQHKWLEVCSISKRHDVPFTWRDKDLINYEFAFGLDRIVYAMHDRKPGS